jgi:CHAT domain-containing protein/tetratricopeptide (TPR) repeat protein
VLEPGDQHLTADELDQLAGVPGAVDLGVNQPVAPHTDASRHLSECLECRRRLEDRIAANSKLAQLKTSVFEARGELCPSDEEWMRVVAGIELGEVSRQMLDHAAHCDHCGPFVHQLSQEFSDSVSLKETHIVQNLESSSPLWQRNMAARLSVSLGLKERRTSRSPASWSWRAPVFGCAAVAITAIVVWGLLLRPEKRVQRLIAEAYTERRNLEPRFPGAVFAPVRVERAQHTSHLDSPSSLLEAEREITNSLSAHPSDPFWLQSRARAELLEGNYSGAIDALHQALAAATKTPALLIDLATAYSERADATGDSEDYGRAIDLLGQALQLSPRDPIALFNRALISQKALLFSQSVEDWKAYLQIDPTGPWADEARSRLQEAQREQQKRKQSSLRPLLTPEQFASLKLADVSVVDVIDEQFDAYYNKGLSVWLPLAYPRNGAHTPDVVAARRALAKLAQISVSRHSDRWWVDLLSGASSPSFPMAVNFLASAVTDNEHGSTNASHASATLALQLFRSSNGNPAGILKADLEDLYAFNIEQNAENCSSRLRSIHSLPSNYSYRHLQIEALIQRGNCLWLHENLGDALAAYSSAINNAKDSGFRAILLGAEDHWSMAAGAGGNHDGAWKIANDGLKQFWDGRFEDVRGYNFYYSLYEIARSRREPSLEVAIWKEAMPLTESSQDLAQVAVAHSLFGNSALDAHDSVQAADQFNQANTLFAQAPQSEATRLAQLEVETRLGGVEVDLGRHHEAAARMQRIEPEIARLSDDYLKVLFYDKFARALIDEGNKYAGEMALKTATHLAELQLQSVRDDASRIQWKINASVPYRDLVTLLLDRRDVEGALELWEGFKAARPLYPTANSSPRSAPDYAGPHRVLARARQLSKATVISYALFPHQLVIWVYDDRGIKSYRTDLRSDDLSDRVSGFREMCSNPKSDLGLLRKQARSLFAILVAPIGQFLQPGRALVIELDEGLNGLPVEALLDDDNRYLGERCPILFSLGILNESRGLAGTPVTRNASALVVAVPAPRDSGQNSIHPLSDVVEEAQAVAHQFTNAHFLAGSSATLGQVLNFLPDVAVFHFAGHSSNSYTSAGLLLFDGPLTSKVLQNARILQTQLVVLSGCDTEEGSLGEVDATDSLVASFTRAGVPRIIASRWNVDSAVTLRFMNAFYASLSAGSRVEQSLVHAQKVVRDGPGTIHPFYWAAFAVFGSDAM